MKYFIIILLSFSGYTKELSYSLIDIKDIKTIESKNSNQQMALASVSKIYSTYYVLNKLDIESRFKTNISQSKNSELKQGILNGDLIFESSGDPLVTVQNYIDLIYQLKNNGLKEVRGKFLIVNGRWNTQRLSQIGLEDQADNPSIGVNNFEFNRFKFDRKSKKTIPNMDYLKVTESKFRGDGLKFKLKELNSEFEHWLKNKNEVHSYREELPVRNSNLFSGSAFRYLASLHGIKLPKPEIGNGEKGRILAQRKSLPVERLLELGLEYSNNLIAEMLLYKVHKQDPLRASEKMRNWFVKEFNNKSVSWEKTNFVNSSGLSLQNQSTTDNLSKFLATAYNNSSLKRNLISFLSINGHSGGLRKRLMEPKYNYHVYGKTGSLFFVNNLAGYIRGKSGKLMAFSIFMTDSKKRAILNKSNSSRVNKVRQGSKAWHSQSTQKIDSLLRRWIDKY